jgi:SSS family solute:Na+ symporter/sodium/pantothenate symporter
MSVGAGVTLALYAYGSYLGLNGVDQGIGPPPQGFGAYYLLGFEPCVWGLLSSLTIGVVVSLLTSPPDPGRVALLFDEQPPDAPAPATLELHPDRVPPASRAPGQTG